MMFYFLGVYMIHITVQLLYKGYSVKIIVGGMVVCPFDVYKK